MVRRLFITALLALSGTAGGHPWEVAVMFLVPDADGGFQQDIDENMRELARTKPGDSFRLSVLRDLPERRVEYFPDPKSSVLHDWQALFFAKPTAPIEIAGEFREFPATPPLLKSPEAFRDFLGKAFRNPAARRVLVLYTHGEGYEGARELALKDLFGGEDLTTFLSALPHRPGRKPLDVMWFDSCYMASLEAMVELEPIADFWMSSEDLEFSAGAPFDALSLLADGPADVAATTSQIAAKFVDSYARVLAGDRRKGVASHSATISVVELNKLPALVKEVGRVVKTVSLDEDEKAALAADAFYLEKNDLVDFGSLLGLLPAEATEKALGLLEWAAPRKVLRRRGAKDRVEFHRTKGSNPVLYNGYTRNPSLKGKRYSGLNVASPLRGLPDVNYSDLRFERATRWSTLAD